MMLMGSRDLCRDGMHPGQGIEQAALLARVGVGRRAQADAAVLLDMHLGERDRRTGDVAAEAFQACPLRRLDDVTDVDREARVPPGPQALERLGAQSLCLVETAQQDAPEALFEHARLDHGQGKVGAAAFDEPVGDQRVHVRMPVAVGTEGLDGGHHARQGVTPPEHLLEAAPRSLVGRAAQDAKQSPLALEEPAKRLGHGEDDMSMRDRKQHDLDQERAEQRGTLGLAARAEVARLAGEGQQVLGLAVGAAQAREARLVAAAVQVLLYGPSHDRPQGAVALLEALGMLSRVGLEVCVQELVEAGPLGMAGTVVVPMVPWYRGWFYPSDFRGAS